MSSAERAELSLLRSNIQDLNAALQRSRDELIQLRTEVSQCLQLPVFFLVSHCFELMQNERLRNDVITVRNNYESLESRYAERQRRVMELENSILTGGGGGSTGVSVLPSSSGYASSALDFSALKQVQEQIRLLKVGHSAVV